MSSRPPETLITLSGIPVGTYLESNGLAVLEAENGTRLAGVTHSWLTSTAISGYTGTSYLHVLPDTDTFYPADNIADSPQTEFLLNLTTPSTGSGQAPGTYTLWARGYADNAAADSLHVGLDNQVFNLTGFDPEQWTWANTQEPNGEAARVAIPITGLYTFTVWMREDGMRVDRLLLTTDTNYIPSSFGPAESERQTSGGQIELLDHTIVYTYDNLYRLTDADYSTGETYAYDYDPVGNRLQQIINGDTTDYLYDAANRLEQVAVSGQPVANYTFDNNGNLLQTGVMTNTWDAANRLVETERVDESASQRMEPIYNGVGDRVGQTVGVSTTYFALDIQGLPEVIQTSEGNSYLHLPGVIVVESAADEVRYLLSDGLGSVRQAVDDTGVVAAYYEFDPYGNPVDNVGGEPYGYTGEWYEGYIQLLHLRARWYSHETGTFLSRDPVESEPPYLYARGNPINAIDSSGLEPDPHDPWDPEWCNNWWYPKKLSCDLITHPSTPYYARLGEMHINYLMVAAGQKYFGYHIGSKILRSYLNPFVTEVTFEGPGWKLEQWIRSQPNDRLMDWHDKQMEDFYNQAILPGIENCNTGPVRWKARGGGGDTENPVALELSTDGGIYTAIPIFNIFNERGFSLGKFYLKGDFSAENIQMQGDTVTADVTIERYIDDVFRFDDDDFGGIPFHRKFGDWPNPGFGDMPHVWLQELQKNNMVSNVDVHMKWIEKFRFNSKNIQ